MLWLVLAIVTAGAGTVAVQHSLRRLGADVEKRFRDAPVLIASAFAEGSYGRLEGALVATEPPIAPPGASAPCVFYELVVRGERDLAYLKRATGAPSNRQREWVVIDRIVGGVDVILRIDGVEVAIDTPEAILVAAPGVDHRGDPRQGGPPAARTTTTVRAIAPDARVRVVGTLTRDADLRPEAAAAAGYRETPIRWRLTARKDRPLLLGIAP